MGWAKWLYLGGEQPIPHAEGACAEVFLAHVEGGDVLNTHLLALLGQKLQRIEAGTHVTGSPLCQRY